MGPVWAPALREVFLLNHFDREDGGRNFLRYIVNKVHCCMTHKAKQHIISVF